MQFRITTFGPSETAEITGASTMDQRNWRRREFIPSDAGGHARFNLFDLLRFTFVADMGGLGIGPTDAFPSSEWVAHHALFYALAVDGIVEGSANEIAEREAGMPPREPVEGRAAELRHLEDRLGQARRIAKVAFARPSILPVPMATIWPDGTDLFGRDAADVEAHLSPDDPRRGQPAITIQLPAFARRVVSRLPRSPVACVPEGD